jgi:homospermidine synthase
MEKLLSKSFLNKYQRKEQLTKLFNSITFNNVIFMIGFGSVGPAIMYMFLKICNINPSNIFIIDKDPNIQTKINFINSKMNFINVHIDHKNYLDVFKYLAKDDIIIDCSYDIQTLAMFKLCQSIGASYINSSIEEWTYKDIEDPIKYSLFYKHMELEKENSKYKNHNTNFIVSMGCNPGCVSTWSKLGIELINLQEGNHKYENYGELAHKLKLNVVHISEKDTQKTNKPKQENEYCNTWAGTAEPMYEEATGPVEVSWGTHEYTLPNDMVNKPDNKHNLLILKRRGMSTFAISYVPISKNFIGMMVRHDEAFTIGREFTYYKNNKLISKPSMYYVYHPCDSTMMSFHELRERDLKYQDNNRLLTNDITNGRDELGLTFFLNNGNIYWIGSLLDIHEARDIFDNKFDKYINATISQVVGGYLSGILHIINNIQNKQYRGLLDPDKIPYEELLKIQIPFQGDFLFTKVNDWDYAQKYNNNFEGLHKIPKYNWQFDEFCVKY